MVPPRSSRCRFDRSSSCHRPSLPVAPNRSSPCSVPSCSPPASSRSPGAPPCSSKVRPVPARSRERRPRRPRVCTTSMLFPALDAVAGAPSTLLGGLMLTAVAVATRCLPKTNCSPWVPGLSGPRGSLAQVGLERPQEGECVPRVLGRRGDPPAGELGSRRPANADPSVPRKTTIPPGTGMNPRRSSAFCGPRWGSKRGKMDVASIVVQRVPTQLAPRLKV